MKKNALFAYFIVKYGVYAKKFRQMIIIFKKFKVRKLKLNYLLLLKNSFSLTFLELCIN